jgi:2-dehydro-3-deoxyphosphogalactonate aldolase
MSTLHTRWENALEKMPLVAILRGIQTEACLGIGEILIEQGFEIIEVPLNSPNPLLTIEKLAGEFGDKAVIGAGTVLTTDQVHDSINAGARLIIAPNFDIEIAQASCEKRIIYCPGVSTPSEAFSAIKSGASALKLFPAELITPSVLKAMRAVLPTSTTLLPVGGITPCNMKSYLASGANGFGIGSALYKPGKSSAAIRASAKAFVDTYLETLE